MEEVYELESTEQMRAISDDLRQRVLDTLTERPMTATQVGERLGIPPTRAHYHVRELERVGLVRLVETREKGGILEKYFQPVARTIVIPPSLVRRDRGGVLAATADFVQDMTRRLLTGLSRASREEAESGERKPHMFAVSRTHVWATREELSALLEQQQALFEPYERPRGVEGEKEHSFTYFLFPTELGEEETDDAGEPLADTRPVTVAGVVWYGREELEQALASGRKLDITVYGMCIFSSDVPADLAAAAVARFILHGQLRASDEVRAVLDTKKG